jgi:hypothetical protein
MVEKKKGRVTGWIFIEILCAFRAVTAVNMKLYDGSLRSERPLGTIEF